MKLRVSEKVEQAHGVQLLRSLGAKVYVLGHPSPRDGRTFRGTGQTAGLPDVCAFLPAPLVDGVVDPHVLVFLWWEAKAKHGRLRPEQALFRAFCLDAALEHVVGDLDALIAWLVEWRYLSAANVPHYRHPVLGTGGGGCRCISPSGRFGPLALGCRAGA